MCVHGNPVYLQLLIVVGLVDGLYEREHLGLVSCNPRVILFRFGTVSLGLPVVGLGFILIEKT